MPLWHPGQSTALVTVIGLFAALAMAVTVAAISGLGVVRLARSPASSDLGPSPTSPARRYDEGDSQQPARLGEVSSEAGY